MLFELNLAAFVAARINYGFIMELDIRTAIDHRQFLEIPAMLFAALSLCFYFSVHQVGEPAISPYASVCGGDCSVEMKLTGAHLQLADRMDSWNGYVLPQSHTGVLSTCSVLAPQRSRQGVYPWL
jgi:hypothetical protein